MELWIIITLLSALIFGVKDILAKKLFLKNVSPNQLIFEQAILTLIIIILLFYIKVDFNSFYLYWDFYILKAFSVGIATLFYFKLLKKYEISNVSPILNLSPLFLLILSSIFLSEIISLVQFIGIILILISTYFLEIIVYHHDKKNPHNYHFAFFKKLNSTFFIYSITLLISISFAAIFDKKLLQVINVYSNMFFTSLILLIILLVYYIKENYLKKAILDIKNEPETLIIASFSIISSFLILFAIAIPSALVSLIVPLRRTSTLFSSFFGGILFHEKHLFKKLLIILVMLIGIILIVL